MAKDIEIKKNWKKGGWAIILDYIIHCYWTLACFAIISTFYLFTFTYMFLCILFTEWGHLIELRLKMLFIFIIIKHGEINAINIYNITVHMIIDIGKIKS